MIVGLRLNKAVRRESDKVLRDALKDSVKEVRVNSVSNIGEAVDEAVREIINKLED